ncbi:MAG: iron-containing alcohol dehydrogenase [Clostridia bacterium]|nr:iron-containing alcohol dehydrogenase [Clostridia bacterium]
MGSSAGKRAWCRTFQAVMKVGNYFLPWRIPETLSGEDSVLELPDKLKAAGHDSVLVVTDESLMKLGLPVPMLNKMKEMGLNVAVYSSVQPNPTDRNVEDGFRMFREKNCKAIVAFGGGSPMDCAKGIAAKQAHPKKAVRQLQGLLKVHKRIVPFYAVPTTAGTGSETTVAAVITEEKTHHKASINDPVLMPRLAVLDPKLTQGLPPFITATTGMDALCHAVESYTNGTYLTHLEREYAKNAVRLIHEHILAAYEDGSSIEHRQAMQWAAFYAGRSFTRGCVGYVHAVGHTLGGLYGVPHGLAMSMILPCVLRQYGEKVFGRLAELADECGIQGRSDAEKAESFISWIEETNRKMQIPRGTDVIQDKDIPQIIAWADKEANPLYPVPVIWGEDDFRTLLETLRKQA